MTLLAALDFQVVILARVQHGDPLLQPHVVYVLPLLEDHPGAKQKLQAPHCIFLLFFFFRKKIPSGLWVSDLQLNLVRQLPRVHVEAKAELQLVHPAAEGVGPEKHCSFIPSKLTPTVSVATI